MMVLFIALCLIGWCYFGLSKLELFLEGLEFEYKDCPPDFTFFAKIALGSLVLTGPLGLALMILFTFFMFLLDLIFQ